MKPGIVPLTQVRTDPEASQRRPEQGVFRLLARVFSYTARHKHLLRPLIAQVLLRSALLPLSTWAMAAVINGPIEHHNPQGIAWGVLGFAGLTAFTNWMFHFRYRLALELGEAVIHDLRIEVMRHVFQMPMVFFDTTKVGRIIGRVTSDIDSIRTGVQDVVFISAVQLGQMVIAGVMMLYYDWALFLVVILLAPIIWSLNKTFTRRMTEAQRNATESYSRIAATLAESVSGVRVTQGFVRENLNAAYFRELVADQAKFNMVMSRQSAVFLPLLECNTQIFTALLIVIGGWRVLSPETSASVGNIVQFFFLAALLFDPIKNIGNQYTSALAAMVGAERVFRLLDTPPAWSDTGRLSLPIFTTPHTGGMVVEFKNLWFAYESERPVLKNINFRADSGQTIALVGHTGSGKTSITNLIAKLYLPQSGRLLLNGIDIRDIRAESLHSQIAAVHQHCFLFEGSISDNIRFAQPDAHLSEVQTIIRELGFEDMISALPSGLDTRIGEGGSGLSSGQRQLVSFARALLTNPKLLILDEATSAIDTPTEARIQSALQRLVRGRTSFVVAHRLSTIRNADLILVLDQGEIAESGTHAELLRNKGLYAALHDHFVRA